MIRLPDRRPALVSGATLLAAVAAVPDGAGDTAGVYVVRRGEALSEIATRLKVSQADLIRFNRLQDSEFIFEGQKLRTTAESPVLEAEAELPVTSPVAASPGGPPPGAPQLSKVALSSASPTTAPLDPVSRSQAEALGPSLVPEGAATPEVTDAVDYSVAPDGTVHIAAAETIGHYAEWLGVDARRLRALNHLGSGRSLMVGQRLRLDFSRVSHEKFEERRRDYHARLQSEFFDAHRIEGTEIYVARRGDSLWTVTQRYPRLPAWLLQEYNSDTDFSELRPGTQLVVPKVEEATAAN
jgi:membrane-bound lytic murein transglycosylase D